MGEGKESGKGGIGIGWRTKGLVEVRADVAAVFGESGVVGWGGWDPPCVAVVVVVVACSREVAETNPWIGGYTIGVCR